MREIEKNVTLLPTRRRTVAKYPLHEMAVGDSFLEMENPQSARAQASATGKMLGCKFTSRRQGRGVRIWRVA